MPPGDSAAPYASKFCIPVLRKRSLPRSRKVSERSIPGRLGERWTVFLGHLFELRFLECEAQTKPDSAAVVYPLLGETAYQAAEIVIALDVLGCYWQELSRRWV